MIDGGTLWQLVERRVAETPDALCTIDEQDRSLSFAEFEQAALRAAAGLAALGVREGTPVTWVLPTCNDALVLTAALARLQACALARRAVAMYGLRLINNGYEDFAGTRG